MCPQNKNSQKTCYPLSISTPVAQWEREGTPSLKTVKVRVYPTTQQKQTLRQWFGTTRCVYNKTLYHINKTKCKINFINLRDKFVTRQATYKRCTVCGKVTKSNRKAFVCCESDQIETIRVLNEDIAEWEYDTPKNVRANAVKDLVKAFEVAFINLQNKNIRKFKMKYRKKKDHQSIVIQKDSIHYHNGSFNVYSKSLGRLKVGKRSRRDYVIDNDTRLSFDGFHYYIHVIQQAKTEKYRHRKNVVSLDPGIRTFLTGYSQEEVVEMKRDPIILLKLRTKIAKLQSVRSKRKIKNYAKKIKKLYDKISNVVDDLHWRSITYLTRNYKKILLPNFESQKMMSRNKNLNRSFGELKHYRFRMRLVDKVKSIKHTKLYIVTEEYTSKTCGNCGFIKNDLKSNKEFKCSKCGVIIDRDINGARNIMLKHLKLN